MEKSFAEFAARHGGELLGSFFAATCAWRKTLCAERVFIPTHCVGMSAGRSESLLAPNGRCPFGANFIAPVSRSEIFHTNRWKVAQKISLLFVSQTHLTRLVIFRISVNRGAKDRVRSDSGAGGLDGRTGRGLSPKGSSVPTLLSWQRRVNGVAVMLILSTWSAIGQMLDRQRSFLY